MGLTGRRPRVLSCNIAAPRARLKRAGAASPLTKLLPQTPHRGSGPVVLPSCPGMSRRQLVISAPDRASISAITRKAGERRHVRVAHGFRRASGDLAAGVGVRATARVRPLRGPRRPGPPRRAKRGWEGRPASRFRARGALCPRNYLKKLRLLGNCRTSRPALHRPRSSTMARRARGRTPLHQ
jgi:hypothetical protein